ncbi:MAG: hypothetical protein COS95_00435, partial [Ignavibacteriales bacterium CG07_land_8_20_14_0_80_59_12]
MPFYLKGQSMSKSGYRSMESLSQVNRREFLRLSGAVSSAAGLGLALGRPPLFSQEKQATPPVRIKTNVDDALAVPRT